MITDAPGPGARTEDELELILEVGWEAVATAPGAIAAPEGLEGLELAPARVPGTAAAVLRAAGLYTDGEPAGAGLDERDWWFRTRFDADRAATAEQVTLELGGIATIAEVFLNGERILESASMFVERTIDVGARLQGVNELAICCRALAPLLTEPRRPRARWRTRVVGEGNLRFFRTMILGRAPGFAPGPAAVGPWRPVRLRRRRRLALDDLRLRPRIEGSAGVLAVEVRLRTLDGGSVDALEVELDGPSGRYQSALALGDERGGSVGAHGELSLPGVARWWPHTHGEPALHRVRLTVSIDGEAVDIDAGRVGFRDLAAAPGIDTHGLALRVNDVAVFARGAVWTPVDAIGLAPSRAELRQAVEAARDAGMNILRVPGTSAYESTAFHDLCDELGMLVWQDFMFANLDYPIADDDFRALVETEVAQVLGRLSWRPSTAVLCGNSEVEQQAAMFGVDPALARGTLFEELLPGAIAAAGCDAIYIRSAPSGGDLPFRPDRGVANYFGVGGYRRPLEDARRADVRFATECLAFANVPVEAGVERIAPGAGGGAAVIEESAWKAAIPRDTGSDWDFEDVRDHYLELLFGLDAAELRSVDPDRYLELSRAVSGEVMAEVLGEWRRAGSRCAGAIVLWLRDLKAGAGWGVIDDRGEPKVAYHHLRRALAPAAVWTTDEGLGGIAVELANDAAAPLTARLRVGVYRELEQRVGEAEEAVELPAHGSMQRNIEGMLGRFIDASYAYRFGPPAHDLIVVTLEPESGGEPISQSFRFPAGRPTAVEDADALGLRVEAEALEGELIRLRVGSHRLAYGVRIHADGFTPSDDAFSVEPGGARLVTLEPREAGVELAGATLTALNLEGRMAIPAPAGAA